MAESSFDFNKFIEETKSALLSPAEYFSTMSKTGGFVEPLIKAVIYGTLAGIINFLWITFNLVPAFGSMFGGRVGGICYSHINYRFYNWSFYRRCNCSCNKCHLQWFY